MKNVLQACGIATALTVISYIIAFYFGWTSEVIPVEAGATWFSYASTWLCVVQSRWNYVFGIIATILLSIFFVQIGLFSSAALNIYLPIALLYGWLRWGPDGNTRPVTWLGKDRLWVAYITWSAGIWAMLYAITVYFGAVQPIADSSILGLSVLAQLLLDNKRIETWIFWAIGNVIAIWLYSTSGSPILAMQFVIFLGNTVYGAYMWHKSMKKEPIGEFVGENVEVSNA